MNIPDGLPTLSAGAHQPGEGRACVMEYVSLLAGEEWSDSPSCTAPLIAFTAQRVNDRLENDERHLLVPLIGRLFGTDDPDVGKQLTRRYARAYHHGLIRADLPVPEFPANNVARAYFDDLLRRARGLRRHIVVPVIKHVTGTWDLTDATSADLTMDVRVSYPYAESLIAGLSSLIDEYDRLSGRTTHRTVTDAELRELATAVAR